MSEVRDGLAYTEEHEWAAASGARTVRIGITDHAQNELGDIVFVEFPEIGAEVGAGDGIGTIESVKTVSELYCPVAGKVTKVNEALAEQPELINSEPYDGGWILEVEVEGGAGEALARLLDPEAYRRIAD